MRIIFLKYIDYIKWMKYLLGGIYTRNPISEDISKGWRERMENDKNDNVQNDIVYIWILDIMI